MDLIGREAEFSLVTERVRDRRLVTLTGVGGIGKTALARAAVAQCASDFGEGSRVVDLTRIDASAGVHESLAAQLGYTSFRSLIDAPGDHSVLILVDNCEHVLDSVADAVDQLLNVCQMPTVVATSRSPLEVAGEAVIPIGPLPLPSEGVTDGPAVRLFVERARDAGVEVEPNATVGELCRRLDGVPLAIELAAARVRSMTPAEILDRLCDGLDVLDRPRRQAARRHRSLRAAIEWSFHLLDERERDLFVRLSVFPGPFTSNLAHAVASGAGAAPGETDDVLDRLVSASMVVAESAGETTRYRLLETIRAFARRQLDDRGERSAVEAALVDHVVVRVVDIIQRGSASWSPGVLADLLALYDNITAAVRWCIANDERPDRAVLLVAVLWGVVHQAHTEEIGTLAEEVLMRWPSADHPLRSDATATAATCRYMLGDLHGAIALAEAALDEADASPYAPATLRRAMAQAHRAGGDTAAGIEWFAATADAARRLGMASMATEADCARAQILADLGRYDDALALVNAARIEAQAAGSDIGAAWVRAIEGSVLLRADPARAVPVLEDALAASRRIAYDAGTSVNLRSLAIAALLLGDTTTAAARMSELLDALLARGSTYELRLVFDITSVVVARAGREAAAADLAATALSLPVVSITASVGHELFTLDPEGGSVLPVRDAILVARAELDVLLAGDRVPSRSRGIVDERVGVFRRAGDHWEVGFAGESATVRAAKGMSDLATLLRADGREVHCLELIGSPIDEGGTGDRLDAAARRNYERRVRELQEEIDEADSNNDAGRAERSRIELDLLVDELTRALGLGGKSRTSGGAAERARSAVTQRIRATIRRIGEIHPRLGRHLRTSIRTGIYCSYAPEDPVRWQL